ncbi:hypothetical protein PQR71_12890 [Paraburkholderia fungorum]|uniref:hypothetical protein n=1 Tax=Paraburkholderia fungorum TaxID=134537 RepID=UPI0038BCEBEC
MRLLKTTTKKQQKSSQNASVTNLSAYRQSKRSGASQPPPQAIANLSARHSLIAEHVTSRLGTCAPSLVAAAIVLLRSDGSLDTSATGVEVEYAPFLMRGLNALSATINRNTNRQRRDPAQGGSVLFPVITAIGFMAATYINEYAWLDAALSLAAQLCASHFWKRSA